MRVDARSRRGYDGGQEREREQRRAPEVESGGGAAPADQTAEKKPECQPSVFHQARKGRKDGAKDAGKNKFGRRKNGEEPGIRSPGKLQARLRQLGGKICRLHIEKEGIGRAINQVDGQRPSQAGSGRQEIRGGAGRIQYRLSRQQKNIFEFLHNRSFLNFLLVPCGYPTFQRRN